jgi:YesN/AraC family two-component response regulator
MSKQYSILIVDDELPITQSFKEFFEDYDYIVETAQNGKEGLEKLRNGRFDVAIVDIKMPEMDGIEMIRQANQGKIPPKWIMLTGHGDRNEVVETLKLGAVDWFDKQGIDMAELQEKVRKLTSGKLEYIRQVFTRISQRVEQEEQFHE